MEISTRTYYSTATVNIETTNVTISEDVDCNGEVPEELIEEMITAANDLSRFNKVSDVDFVEKIIGSFLNDTEVEQLIEELCS